MNRLLDVLAVLLLGAAAWAVVLGILALGDGRDLHAFYWTGLGAVLLKGAVDVLRPLRSS